MKSKLDTCPDLETLAAYLDGGLNESDRVRIAEHIAGCESCYFVFTEAAQMRATGAETSEHLQPPSALVATAGWRSSKVLWSSAAGLAVAASLLIAIARGVVPTGSDSSDLRALVAAVGTDRTFEPRLTGGFAYGPVRAPVRGVEAIDASPDVRIAVATLEKNAARDQTVKSLHETGIGYLVVGDISRAIVALEGAASHEQSARLMSDLAAAYLVRGIRANRPEDVSRALTLATGATQRDGGMPEALFNRALALDHLSMFNDARRAWQAYLTVDSQSGWAAEARIREQRLGIERQD